MESYSLVIKNATIIDPEKESMRSGNIGLEKGKIAIITDKEIVGKKEIDAQKHIVCPGFIDIHGHIDGNLQCAKLSLLQGVTTTVGGNCGLGPVNLKKFFDKQDEKGFLINQAQLVGHSFSLREVVGVESPYIAATDFQIKQMGELIEKAFEEGAIGLSFGIEYAPGCSFKEIIELSHIAARYKKLIPIHTRLNGPRDVESLREAIRINELTGAPVLISHFVYQYGNEIMTEALDIVDDARKSGLNISVDSGMYNAFSTFIGTSVFDEDNIKNFGWRYEDMIAATGRYKGQRLTESLYLELREKYPKASVVCFAGLEEKIYEALLKEYVMLSSDTGPSAKGEGHPQCAGNFARFFRKMVREQESISLMDAIKKCTILPAETLNLKGKGRLTEGADADIVVFDRNTIADKSEYVGIGNPDAKPEGIDYVIVNGEIVVRDGNIIDGVLPGKTIRDFK